MAGIPSRDAAARILSAAVAAGNSDRSLIMVATPIDGFFSHLAERRYKENDLSDITWALCRTVPEFKHALVEFCDPSIPREEHVHIEREVDLAEGCRIDFVCRAPSGAIFIEVKIYDQQYHIQQYARAVPPGSRLVLLTNHPLSANDFAAAKAAGWDVRQWYEFAEHVERIVTGNALVDAYVTYLRKVCSMIQLRDVRLDQETLYSLVSLDRLLREAIGAASHDAFHYEPYRYREYDLGWRGAGFQMEHRQGEHQRRAWGLFGLDFKEPDSMQLEVWLDRDWNAELLRPPLPSELAQAKGVRLNDNGLGIVANEETLQRLIRLPLQEQRSMVASIFQELMQPIEHHMATFM